MKDSRLILLVFTIALFAASSYAQGPSIERANAPEGESLELCESKNVGNLGFYNPYDETHYVILINRSYGEEIIAHFIIPPNETKWQTALKTYKNNFFYYVFKDDPGKDLSKIKYSTDYMFKSRVFVVQCENELVTIAY